MKTEKQTITQSISLVGKARKSSNEQLLAIFNHLFILEKEGTWKSDSYYEGRKDLTYLKDLSFDKFIKEAFSITNIWYVRMKNILDLPRGKKLFLRYGRSNMVTYMNSTEEERIKIIELAEKSPVFRSFYSLKQELFPQTKKRVRQHSLWAKYQKALKQIKKLKEENETLRKTIKLLSKNMDKKNAA